MGGRLRNVLKNVRQRVKNNFSLSLENVALENFAVDKIVVRENILAKLS